MAAVSIIVGVYNGEEYLAELLDSIKNQTNSDWICICVDDGSTDSSAKILKSYSQNDSRYIIKTRANGGVGAARNSALDIISTPFVMFADQDDRLQPDAVEVALREIIARNVDVVRFDSNRHVKKSVFVWEHIFRYDAIKDVRFPEITGGEDTAFFWELDFLDLKRSEIKNELYFNRLNEGSFSRAVSPKYIRNVFAGFAFMRRVAIERGASCIQVKRKLFPHIFWFSVSVIVKHFSFSNLSVLFNCIEKHPYD